VTIQSHDITTGVRYALSDEDPHIVMVQEAPGKHWRVFQIFEDAEIAARFVANAKPGTPRAEEAKC
jgi:hypothetical protein